MKPASANRAAGVILAVPVLLAAAVSTRVELIDEMVRIPQGDWRYVQVGLKQRPGVVLADYVVESGGPEVRLALVPREGLERLPDDFSEGALAATAPANSGHLAYRVQLRGVYAVLIDNRGASHPATVRLRVSLDFGVDGGSQVTRLSPRRQFTVIAISFAVFFAIVTYSARRLLRGIRR